jgi:hypothetical protein
MRDCAAPLGGQTVGPDHTHRRDEPLNKFSGPLYEPPSAEALLSDPSTERIIHGRSIDVDAEVLDLLCPSAASKEVRQRIMDGTIDVSSLPGKEDAVGDTVEVMANR